MYLEQLFTKKHTLDKNTHDRMQDDEVCISLLSLMNVKMKLRDFFSKYTKEKTVSDYLQILADLRQLIDS